jgi:hypothetical protein
MHTLSLRSLFFLVSAGLLFANGPASARGFGGGHATSAPHAMMATHAAAQSFAEGRGFMLPSSATAQPITGQGSGKASGHHPGKPSGGSIASSAASSSAGAVIEQSTPTTKSSAPPVAANTTRNSALTGGTDPAIGQSSPPVPEVFASGGGTAAVDHSGGSGNTLAACMQLWDAHTHMSKPEWRVTCGRTLNGIDLPADGGMTVPTSTRAHVRHTRTRVETQ